MHPSDNREGDGERSLVQVCDSRTQDLGHGQETPDLCNLYYDKGIGRIQGVEQEV